MFFWGESAKSAFHINRYMSHYSKCVYCTWQFFPKHTCLNRWLMLTINAVPAIKFSLNKVDRD